MSTKTEEKKPGAIERMRALADGAHPFKILEVAFTAVALVAVVVTVGPAAGARIGVAGEWGLILGGAIAIVLDLLWVGAMRQLGRAIWQRHRPGIIAMGITSVVATAASTTLMVKLGHAGPFAYLPGLALAATGLRVYVDNAFASRGQARGIFEREAVDRDERAQAEADARHAVAAIKTQAVRVVAEDSARATAQLALAEQRVAAQVEQNERYAALEKTLTESEEATGKAAELFRARKLTSDLEHRLALPVWGPSVALPAPTAKALSAASVTPSVTPPVTRGVTGGVTQGAPEIEAASQDGETPVTPDPEDPFGESDTSALNMEDLEAIAAVAGVETPRPDESLTDEQLVVVLRWLRHTEQPPRSYRKARALFTDLNFVGGERRVRNAWAALEDAETPSEQ